VAQRRGSFQITARHYAAPGTVERVRTKAVEQTLSGGEEPTDQVLAAADPKELLRALQSLPAPLRAEIRKALATASNR
jgi:hypothetical protein